MVGGALAHHQYHRVSHPPVEHLDDILRNGALFHDRWGEWPMKGRLLDFARLGLVSHDARTGSWHRRDSAAARTSDRPG
ncbi:MULTISPECIES: hypothetical protein [Streptomyces]|uniref:hypothetical protein n=1 Tax=Streptomyces TaxID=1883 RepID=UPI0018E995E2|nr:MULTISPECIES: hypothetical protein [Streptomyces]MBX9421661.1 hypothetical protein [Streptomyces lateritius]